MKVMPLYEVPRNTRIILDMGDGERIPLNFEHIDGMYSLCRDDEGKIVHLAAWTTVEIAE